MPERRRRDHPKQAKLAVKCCKPQADARLAKLARLARLARLSNSKFWARAPLLTTCARENCRVEAHAIRPWKHPRYQRSPRRSPAVAVGTCKQNTLYGDSLSIHPSLVSRHIFQQSQRLLPLCGLCNSSKVNRTHLEAFFLPTFHQKSVGSRRTVTRNGKEILPALQGLVQTAMTSTCCCLHMTAPH